jgi:thioredoxin-like negative regulator of GroEL
MDRFDAELALGQYALSTGAQDLAPAAQHFSNAVQLRRRHPEAIAGLAQTWIRAGMMERAARSLALFEEAAPEETPPVAAIEEARGEFWLAVHVLGDDVPEPLPAEALAASASEEPLVAARRHLSAAVRAEPERMSAWRLLGATYAQDPEAPVEAGLDALQRVADRLPALLDVQLEIGDLLTRMGETDAARPHLMRALASHDPEIIEQARTRLATLDAR